MYSKIRCEGDGCIKVLLGLFRKKPAIEKPAWEKRTLYIYRPGEDAIVYRVEYRNETAYLYRGWSKSLAWRLEDGRLFPAEQDEPSYIIIEDRICDSGGKVLYRVADERIYRAGEREACLVIRNSIIVQGTF